MNLILETCDISHTVYWVSENFFQDDFNYYHNYPMFSKMTLIIVSKFTIHIILVFLEVYITMYFSILLYELIYVSIYQFLYFGELSVPHRWHEHFLHSAGIVPLGSWGERNTRFITTEDVLPHFNELFIKTHQVFVGNSQRKFTLENIKTEV